MRAHAISHRTMRALPLLVELSALSLTDQAGLSAARSISVYGQARGTTSELT